MTLLWPEIKRDGYETIINPVKKYVNKIYYNMKFIYCHKEVYKDLTMIRTMETIRGEIKSRTHIEITSVIRRSEEKFPQM